MSDIFISYRSTHYHQALALRSALESNGFTCWMAPESIPGGSSYSREIPRAIRDCQVFVLLLTDDAQTEDSLWVPRELDMAVNKRKLVLPITPTNFHVNDFFQFYLCFCQSYTGTGDWFSPPEEMIQRIRGHLELCGRTGREQPDVAPPVPEPEPVPVPVPTPEPEPVSDPRPPEPQWSGAETFHDRHDTTSDGGAQAKAAADAYYAGDGVPQDYSRAMSLYQQAADEGNTDAMWMLGNYYFFGITAPADCNTACVWYEKAAKLGHLSAMYDLARCNYYGKLDYPQAFYWFKEAAQKDSIEAMIDVSRCYLRGEGTPKNAAQAVYWLEKAVKEDSGKAKFELAMMYFRGNGVARDYGRAVRLFRDLAKQGYGDAQYYLGYCYYSGKGVIPDPRRAQNLHQQATENGYSSVPYEHFCP